MIGEQPQYSQTVEELDRLIEENKAKKSGHGYFMLTMLFPPAGLFMAWRNGALWRVVPSFTIIYSILL